MKKRLGYTLIEMCIVIAVLSAMLTLAAGIIHGLMGCNHAAQETLEQQTILAKLAETFRADVHAAVDFGSPAAAESQRWELKPPTGPTVVYRLEGQTLIRETKTPDGSTWQTFELAKNATVVIDQHQQNQTTLVTLAAKPGPTATGAPGRAGAGLYVKARLARDRRLAEVPAPPVSPPSPAKPEEKSTNE